MVKNIIIELLDCLSAGQRLDQRLAIAFVDTLADPSTSEVEQAYLTAAWKAKGETPDELSSMASYILSKLHRIKCDFDVFDCCGTGGDHSGSFNISTSSALITACAGIKVAKHGGRKTTSASGSIDLLDALSIPTFTQPDQISESLKRTGLVFISSPALHGLLGRWKGVCRRLGFAGQTGLIGTLTNPVYLTHQIIGVPKPEWGPLMIEALKQLGRKRAMVIHGKPGLDEASYCGQNLLWTLKQGEITELTIDPKDLGKTSCYSLNEIRGGNPEENAAIFSQLLEGKAPQAIFETVVLNTALILMLFDETNDLRTLINKVEDLLLSGEVLRFWQRFELESKKITHQ